MFSPLHSNGGRLTCGPHPACRGETGVGNQTTNPKPSRRHPACRGGAQVRNQRACPFLTPAATPLAGVERRLASRHLARTALGQTTNPRSTPASGVGATRRCGALLVANLRTTPASGVGAEARPSPYSTEWVELRLPIA